MYVSQGVEFTISYIKFIRNDDRDKWIRQDYVELYSSTWKYFCNSDLLLVNCTGGAAMREVLRSRKSCKMFYLYHWIINGQWHREDGPAIIMCDLRDKPISKYKHNRWFVRGVEITDKVNFWIKKNKLPVWWEWTNKEKLLFKLKFV